MDNIGKLSEKINPSLNTIIADTIPVYIKALVAMQMK